MNSGYTSVVPASFSCSYCGEVNDTFIDPSQGDEQVYSEDCQVCCRPNVLYIAKAGDDFLIRAEPES